MMAAKKFTVFRYTEVLEPGRNPYKIVPTFWIKNKNSNTVTVPYPPEEELAQSFDRIFNCQLPLTDWEENYVIIEREVDTYQAGMLYIKRQSTAPLDEETLLVWKQFRLDSVEKIGSGVEQSQSRQSSTSTIIDFEQEKKANSRPSKQSEKTPKNKKSAISKLFNKLSLSKKQHDESNHPNIPDPEEQETSKKKSPVTTHVTIYYAPVAQLASSSEYWCTVPQTSSTASYDEPPDQSLLAKQYRLLCRLHSTLNEATAIAEEFLILYKRDD